VCSSASEGFGFETLLEQLLLEQAPEQDQFIEKLFDMAKHLLASTKGGGKFLNNQSESFLTCAPPLQLFVTKVLHGNSPLIVGT
jgi:hypothetical protein